MRWPRRLPHLSGWPRTTAGGAHLRLAAWVIGICALAFGVLMALSGGGFYFNIVTANINTWEFDRLRWNVLTFLVFGAALSGFGAVSLFLLRSNKPVWTLIAPYLIGAAASAITIGKIGSNVNYLMELCAALSLALGAVLAWVAARQSLQPLFVVLLAVVAAQTAWMGKYTIDRETGMLRERQINLRELLVLEDLVQRSDGQVLGDEYMGMLTLSNKPLVIQPFEVTQLANDGLWNQRPLLRDIRSKKFSYILIQDFPGFTLYKERWTPEMLDAIRAEYTVAQKLAGSWVYVPRKSLLSNTLVPTPEKCANAPWRLPTDAQFGLRWTTDTHPLQFLGRGAPGKVPVVAVADGLLTRRADWDHFVAVQHDDPLKPGKKIWTVYSGMASEQGVTSYISANFPKGTSAKPIKKGEVLGQQGMYAGNPDSLWLNVTFAVAAAAPNGDLPDTEPGALLQSAIDATPYLGLTLEPGQTSQTTQKLNCRG